MKRRSFFKALAAFCVLPQLPTSGWVPVQKLTPFWIQTPWWSRYYSYEYMKAMEALGDEHFAEMRKGMDKTCDLLNRRPR